MGTQLSTPSNPILQNYTSSVRFELQLHSVLAQTTSILEQIKTHSNEAKVAQEAEEVAKEAKEMVKQSWTSEQSLTWVNNVLQTLQQNKVACSRVVWSEWASVESRIP